ncbi:MAG TPA: hypothetical protein VF678_03850 [bacterium]
MPRQNRATPFGQLIAVPDRGLLLGNRGVLVDARGQLTRRQWSTWAWIACVLQFKGRRRKLMQPGTWTELFFLDEATALAAGHRPCGECRRADYQRFKQAWLAANGERLPDGVITIQGVDRILQAERAPRWKGTPYPEATLAGLPNGAMVLLPGSDTPHLVWGGGLLPWSPGGYGTPAPYASHRTVRVITPPSIVAAIRAGYAPLVHPSARTK